ncbi:hypothetical protein EJ357_00575 [Streptomyces cyaneochromogenes]|uniref:Transposase IS4-like domain-containing protein n=1 Tax=Streptomyces cyaneochromogenes TaxID=2496836 RepID=A0A3S9LZ27_9ACTN|nr:transposase [Streptomyces cyaneochromogenes]AZQ32156.1 hypothetical protein EJ357_00575 [Streptomyces cyaneochromogenes]
MPPAVGKDTKGWDEAKKINGRKRHLICDNKGRVGHGHCRQRARPGCRQGTGVPSRALTHPEIAIVWADSAYAGKLVTWATTYLDITIKTVRRPPDAKGFVVLPRRWVVERSWSWIMRARRHCRDHERRPEMSESLITWAAVT